jgi:hypothetical protein
LAILVNQVFQVFQVTKVNEVFQVHLVTKVHLVHLVLLHQLLSATQTQVIWVLLAQLVHQVF